MLTLAVALNLFKDGLFTGIAVFYTLAKYGSIGNTTCANKEQYTKVQNGQITARTIYSHEMVCISNSSEHTGGF